MPIARHRGRPLWLAVVVSSLPIAAASSSPTAQSTRAMSVDDAIDRVPLPAPRISPDGQRV
jgi:hypothetical protein